MSELFHNLGLDAKLLAAQIINFALLLLILQKFAYKPIMGMLSARKREIQRVHDQSKEVEKQLAHTKSITEEMLSDARKKSETIVQQTISQSKVLGEKILADAHAEAQKTAQQARVELERERDKVVQDIKKQLGDTIALAIEKSVGDVLDEKSSKRLFDEAVRKVNA